MRLTVGRRLPVLVTVLLMVVNETTLGLLVHAGNMPWGLGEWPLWRVSLLVAAGIVVLSHTMCDSLEWTVPLLLIIAWLMPVVWYGGLAFWYWQIPVVDIRDLGIPPLFGMVMAGVALLLYWGWS